MPTVSVVRDELFEALGETFTDDQFDDLCFEFGIELDDVTTEGAIVRKERGGSAGASATQIEKSEQVVYKIEVPANRYDLLCLESLAAALRVFRGTAKMPEYVITDNGGVPLEMRVGPGAARIRPYVVGAVLRNVNLTQRAYDRLIDLQEKLHFNICRKRSLVSIGIHNLDVLTPPFTYDALPPSDIKFVPLNKDQEYTAEQLMELYEKDAHLKSYLPLIRDSPVFPVVTDASGNVLSLPPIINGNLSRVSADTRNVLIECTATDLTKAVITLNMLVTSFSMYAERPFHVEKLRVITASGETRDYPDLSWREVTVDVARVRSIVGVDLSAQRCAELLHRMQLPSDAPSGAQIRVSVPPNRSDVLHPCDVIEDIAIAYGYNNLPRTQPSTVTVGRALPVNKLSDLLRLEMAMAGFTEVLTMALCSHAENFEYLGRADDSSAVRILNPKNFEFQVVRTSLIPGILKTVAHNRDAALPLRLFEISDAVVQDASVDVGARNTRRLVAAHVALTSGFEVIHGLVDRIMQLLEVPMVAQGSDAGYYIRESAESHLFPGRQAELVCRGKTLGHFGIVHPSTLKHYDIVFPVTLVEIDIEPFA